MAKIVKRIRRKIYEDDALSIEEKRDLVWLDRLKKWKEFVKLNGHQRMPIQEASPRFTPSIGLIARWANTQRIQARRGQLADWRHKQLLEAGFLFEPLETYWEIAYNELVKFHKKYGHSSVSRFDKKHQKLNVWVRGQRYRQKGLTEEKRKKLDALDFDWGISRNKWDEMYECLKNYYEEHGIAYVQRDRSQEYSANSLNRLHRWCNKQIFYYKRDMLSKDKILLLKQINFDFERNLTIKQTYWDKSFKKLKAFKKKYGHCRVPINFEDKLLARWVQRLRVRRNKLPENRKEQLNKIGFVWHWEEYVWEKNFQLLKEFYEKNGNISVPKKYQPLAEWVRYIRKVKKGLFNYQLSEEQIRRLDEINFNWEPRGRNKAQKRKPVLKHNENEV